MDNEPSLVRPYTLTAGRTRASITLPLEAQIEVAESHVRQNWLPNDVRADILKFCVISPSVAEIAAKLNLPVGVARVLVGDLVEAGHLRILATLDETSSIAERRDVIGRTLRGLRTL
jgi:hypothetical protein